MRKTALLRSLTAIGLSCALFSGFASAESLKQQASQTWDSAAETVDMAGKDAGQAITKGVNNVDKYMDDSSITAQIKSKLLSTSGIDSNDISVKTVKGVVYISGFVKNDNQIDQVINMVSAINGVKSVQSSLMVAN